ncbi:hypothetical protein, partial [Agrobacterium radiobacter]|uniref:hypothetical protein n=1 Tax=Agrobacterium radiobacter TaxID=362 RepID=UPI00342E5284
MSNIETKFRPVSQEAKPGHDELGGPRLCRKTAPSLPPQKMSASNCRWDPASPLRWCQPSPVTTA